MARSPIPVAAGTRFGRLVVIADRCDRERAVLVACDCGSPPRRVRLSALRQTSKPATRSCGCLRDEARARRPTAKLTEEQVREMRDRLAAGETRSALAERFGVAVTTVAHIDRGETWRGV